jgi:hypothetical protein
MTFHDLLFTAANILILPFWVLMILAPRWGWTERIMRSFWPVVLLAVFYVLSLAGTAFVGSADLSGLTPDLSGIAFLLGDPPGAATAWLHMLAFDLFVGRWAYLDSQTLPIPFLAVSVTLFFTLMTGPFGLLLYLAARWRWIPSTPE